MNPVRQNGAEKNMLCCKPKKQKKCRMNLAPEENGEGGKPQQQGVSRWGGGQGIPGASEKRRRVAGYKGHLQLRVKTRNFPASAGWPEGERRGRSDENIKKNSPGRGGGGAKGGGGGRAVPPTGTTGGEEDMKRGSQGG